MRAPTHFKHSPPTQSTCFKAYEANMASTQLLGANQHLQTHYLHKCFPNPQISPSRVPRVETNAHAHSNAPYACECITMVSKHELSTKVTQMHSTSIHKSQSAP